MFYGHQPNQYPKRNDAFIKQMKEDLERQKKQILNEDEYAKVQKEWREKGVKRVPIFIAD